MSFSRFQRVLWVFVLCVFSTQVRAEDPKLSSLGFASEKPESGPAIEVEGGFLVPYTLVVPGTEVEIKMVPIPGGTFNLGSSEDSEGHVEDEAPTVEIEVGPMWVAKYETTWEQYQLYMSMYRIFKDLQGQGLRMVNADNEVDAVTAPTELYDPSFTFKYGQESNLPAVTMTQYAAKQYTKWLSKLVAHQYRLPTEAEWEYACRAGSETEYSFGDDPAVLGDYAWFFENSDGIPHGVGEKKPNPFGLHDMHGNAMELVIGAYTEDGYMALEENGAKTVVDSIQWSETFDNRCVRGGSFEDDAELLRSAARLGSQGEDWKTEDPNVPLSPWWYTDDPTRGIGFRIVRSYKPLDDELIVKFWDIDNEDIELDVNMRLDEGRGVLTPVDPALAEAIKDAQ
ncbi:MAG: formylglycine-generating enzyme family protein [Pirellulaceae bacterium]